MVRFVRWCLIAGALLIIVLDIAGSSVFPDAAYTGIRHNNLVFYEFERGSPNAGSALASGDRILAVDGTRARNINHFRRLVETIPPGTAQTYTVARGDSLFDLEIESAQQPIGRIHRRIASSLTAYTFIFLSLIVILRRPDILGLLFGVNCLIIAFLFTTRPVAGTPFIDLGGELVYDFLIVFFPAFFLHFFLIFPGKEIGAGTKRFLVSKTLYIPPALIFLALFVAALMRYSFGVEQAILRALNSITSIYWLTYIVACIIFFVRTYLGSNKIQRGKFRIATIGLILGVAPLSGAMILRQFLPAVQVPYEHVSVIFLSFISASFALAILRYDAFDMRFVLRAGIVFVLAPAILAASIWLFGGLTGDRLAGMLSVRFFAFFFVAAAIFLTALSPAGASLHRITDLVLQRDRKLYGERVIDFSRRIQVCGTLDGIVDFVSGTLREMFDARFVYFFIGGGETFAFAGGSPEGAGPPLTSLPGGADLIRIAASRKLPLMVEYYDRIWINSNLDRISREFLSLSDAAVIVPLVDHNELLGFILCGNKNAGKPYRTIDAEILELLGERTAAAVRNSLLSRAAEDKEQLEEEVRLAREIQLRLLPSASPPLEHAELLGLIRTSREVGGDLFDYVELAPGIVGVAVADVAGHGIPASLLMTTLQAGFRAEASADRSPAQILGALNRLLYERSDETRFATFFYAVYDDHSRLLSYCNAGAPPPVVIHPDATLVRLQRGGALIGVSRDTHYTDGILKLGVGDLVVSYTDGFIDQENRSGEYFGDAKLIAFLKSNRDLPLDHLLEKLYDTVLGFGSGAIRDDMTAVALRTLP